MSSLPPFSYLGATKPNNLLWCYLRTLTKKINHVKYFNYLILKSAITLQPKAILLKKLGFLFSEIFSSPITP